MSVFDPTGSDLVAITKPAAFAEACYLLQDAEGQLAENPNNITITYNDDLSQMSIGAILPVTITTAVDGDLNVQANDYTASAITAGGDLTATTHAGAVLELMQMLIDAEDAEVAADPAFVPVSTLTFDANANTATLATTLPCSSAVVAGLLQVSVEDYLS